MRVAICSLSAFTYVAECLDLASALARQHQVRYILGYRHQAAVELLERRGLAYEIVLDEPPALTSPASARSTFDLFNGFFFAQAAAVLPHLPERLAAWGADVVLAHLRDFAGLNAAAVVGIPAVSFGSHANPVRREPDDPPFGSGLCRTAPDGQRRLLWHYDRAFHARLDDTYNRIFRDPYGLEPVQRSSTHVSERLVLLSIIPALGNTNAPTARHVHYVGSLFSKDSGAAEGERRLLARLEHAPRPRVFISLGTTYGPALIDGCIEALDGFEGTVVASGTAGVRGEERFIGAPFFSDVGAVLRACDAVVTVCGGKTVMDALAHGLPIVGLPRQGEQREIGAALQEHGAGVIPCLRRWDPAAFRSAVRSVCRDTSYRDASGRLQAQVSASGGAAHALEELLREVAPR